MFDHEEHLQKAIHECDSIIMLISNLVALWVSHVNDIGTDEEFKKAIYFEKKLNNFLSEIHDSV